MLTYATEGNRRTFEIGSDVKAVLKDGVLTVKGYGDTRDFSCDTAPFAEYADEIRTLVIEDGLPILGAVSFYGLGGLQGSLYCLKVLWESGIMRFPEKVRSRPHGSL